MLDVDTEPAIVVAPGGASPAERRVMWQCPMAASLDCSFNRIHHNLGQYKFLYQTWKYHYKTMHRAQSYLEALRKSL